MGQGMSMKVRRRRIDEARRAPPNSVDQIEFVLVRPSDVEAALTGVIACKSCSEAAVTPFDYVLDALTGCDPSVTEYIMSVPALCPACGQPITEKTLVVIG